MPLISIDLRAEFALFKKQDINIDQTYLSYLFPPKSTIYGIFGSILGLSGFAEHIRIKKLFSELRAEIGKKKKGKKSIKLLEEIVFVINRTKYWKNVMKEDLIRLEEQIESFNGEEVLGIITDFLSKLGVHPEYYDALKDWRVGISPLNLDDFPYQRILSEYNTRNSYYGGKKYENIIIREHLLYCPSYKIYLYVEEGNDLFYELMTRLKERNYVFTPFLGKNEFPLSLCELKDYDYTEVEKDLAERSVVETIYFVSDESPDEPSVQPSFFQGSEQSFTIVETYPAAYTDHLHQQHYTAKYSNTSASSIDFHKGLCLEYKEEDSSKLIYVF